MRRQLTTRLGVEAMADSSTKKAVLESARWSNYWKSVLCVGLPFMLLYRVTDYLIFRTVRGNVGMPYSWWPVLIMDVPILFVVSSLWWLYWREIARKTKE
jgi:hypothetical protein